MGLLMRAWWLHLTLWHLTEAASVQIITTFAGNAAFNTESSGNGGLATAAARFRSPYVVAVNASGAVYVADSTANNVRVVTSNGIISAVARTGTAGFMGDSGAATAAQLENPCGVAVNHATGVLFIADSNNHSVRGVGLDGIITTVAGQHGMPGHSGDFGKAISALLNYPYGIAVNSLTGDLLIADSNNNAVRKVDTLSKLISAVAGTGAAGNSGDGSRALQQGSF